ncbi:MAG TPA: hypothetical protein PLT85_17260, partial [Thauera aminoaromatica]|nr:hypothetical protein [Thauera aminoaromatica]
PDRHPDLSTASLTVQPNLITPAEFARQIGVAKQTVHEAVKRGRLSVIDGKLDLEVARIQWDKNRSRRAPHSVEAAAPAGSPSGESTDGGAYWEAKTRREAAEASIAELKEAELRGELVRKVEVERAIASRLVALRESLEVLADRLSALVAAESDAQACRRMLRDEHRKALATFTEQMLVADGAGDGRT